MILNGIWGGYNDFTRYMQCDPYSRKCHYGELTFSLLYAYSEDFILVFSHDEGGPFKGIHDQQDARRYHGEES